MTKSLPVKELHEKLKHKTTTDKWDILVSYSEKQLNQFLKKTWDASASVDFTNVHFEQNLGHGKHAYTQMYDLRFHAPDLEFDTTSGYVYLTMPLSGKSRATDDKPEDAIEIPEGHYSFKVRTQIVGMKGDGGSQTSDSLFHFDDNSESTYYITFHFDTQNSNWQCLVKDKSDPALTNDLNQLVNEVKNWFAAHDNVQWIDYSMAEVSNSSPNSESASDDLLTPSKFVFSCQPGVLSVFIHSKGGTRGLGNNPPQFGLEHEQHVTPVPTEYHASIIISRELFLETYLVKNIKKLASSLSKNDPVKIISVDNGLKLELRYDKDKVIKCANFRSYSYDMAFEDLNVDMNTHPLVLTVEDDANDLTPKASWKWDFSGEVVYTNIPHFRGLPFQMSVNHKTDFAEINGNVINATIKFGANDQPKVTFDRKNFDRLISFKLDTFDLHMPQLNFFRTQNIFAPGKQMINAKKLMLPYDLVLLGDINVA
ncbi:uncharacterized protein NFIA_003640 [Aspergillus fischeri NRRL 181]|uniref:Uncharacterized protein n=1 Tax=Neosartorya fischeri (strain ATCC 1020 / DSM 3700 / CBS 544.65 / FGSC A1164 / JCM 1740 / NRRL 181 / WB 181) TaxID=331117 RepID=A1DJW9_NEOFI|nr:uncharacterized protein NFIA_003640 [Aspergillus fischeri NRRL 181]EAW17008.1 hypothetical protein NFIA_003640 [Aspergillus fischeri NRRL 181]